MSPPDEEEVLPRLSYVEDEEDDDDTTSLVSTAAALAGGNAEPALLVVRGKRSVGRIIRVKGRQTVGRAMSSDLQLPEKGVSRQHAELSVLPGGRLLIRDLESSNGVFVKGKRVTQQILTEGDRLQLGDTQLIFVMMDAADETARLPPPIDPVTRLPGRRHLIQALVDDIGYASSCGESVALCIFSVDQGSAIVDVYGYDAADEAVTVVVRTLQELSQDEEKVLARFGPHEIAVVLPDSRLSEACLFCEGARRAVSASRLTFGGQRFRFTVSVGVATFPAPEVEDALRLIEAAENNLFRAFLAGRNQVHPTLSASSSVDG